MGFIGIGTIASAVITGICSLPNAPNQIILSPRNATKSAYLASQFDRVTVAGDNQEVIDRSGLVFLGLNKNFVEVASSLSFRPDQTVISFNGTVRGSIFANAVAPATDFARVIPLPAVAFRESMSLVHNHPLAIEIFDQLGSTIVTNSDEEFASLQAAGCAMGHFYKTLQTTGSWLQSKGIQSQAAAKLVSAQYKTYLSEVVDRIEKQGRGVDGL